MNIKNDDLEYKIRNRFIDVVVEELEVSEENENYFNASVVMAAADIIFGIIKNYGVSKEDMLKTMAKGWDEDEANRKKITTILN